MSVVVILWICSVFTKRSHNSDFYLCLTQVSKSESSEPVNFIEKLNFRSTTPVGNERVSSTGFKSSEDQTNSSPNSLSSTSMNASSLDCSSNTSKNSSMVRIIFYIRILSIFLVKLSCVKSIFWEIERIEVLTFCERHWEILLYFLWASQNIWIYWAKIKV